VNTTAPKPARSTSSGAGQFERFGRGQLHRIEAARGHGCPDQLHELEVPRVAPGHALGEVARKTAPAARPIRGTGP
jgi:hypothetical protein